MRCLDDRKLTSTSRFTAVSSCGLPCAQVLNKVIGIASSPLNRKRAEANQKSGKPAKVNAAALRCVRHANQHPLRVDGCDLAGWHACAPYQTSQGVRVHAQPKWVAFTGGGSAKVNAPGGGGGSGKALTDYLALPVSQYSLLDESLVER